MQILNFIEAIQQASNGEFDIAIKHYGKAIELNPQFAGAYNNRGNAKADLRQFIEALADFDKAITLNPQFAGHTIIVVMLNLT